MCSSLDVFQAVSQIVLSHMINLALDKSRISKMEGDQKQREVGCTEDINTIQQSTVLYIFNAYNSYYSIMHQ